MTSLGNIFTVEKALFKIIFGRYIFIYTDFHNFAAFFKNFGMSKDDKIRFVIRGLRTW